MTGIRRTAFKIACPATHLNPFRIRKKHVMKNFSETKSACTFGSTQILLVSGKDFATDPRTNVLVVPAKKDLSPAKSTQNRFKRVRESVFSAGGERLVSRMRELQKALMDGSADFGPHASLSPENPNELKAGSVVITDAFAIYSRSFLSTRQLYHAVMITGSMEREANKEAIRLAVNRSLRAAMKEKAESIAFPVEVCGEREIGTVQEKARQVFFSIWDFLKTYRAKHGIDNVVVYLHDIVSFKVLQDTKAEFEKFFPQSKP